MVFSAALWDTMFKLKFDDEDSEKVYDCRLRPWYVSAGGAPRDVLILIDASGSMDNSSNQVIAEQFTLALLSALTDDDRVNVLRFNVIVESPIGCFNEKMVPVSCVYFFKKFFRGVTLLQDNLTYLMRKGDKNVSSNIFICFAINKKYRKCGLCRFLYYNRK